jgi:hypothetical protein
MISHFEFNGENPTQEWYRLLGFLKDNGKQNGSLQEIIGLSVSVYRPRLLKKKEIMDYMSLVGKGYWDRAQAIYTSAKGLGWKPSYLGRINGSDLEYDQLGAIKRRLVLMPNSKVMTCIVQRPEDLKRAAFMQAGIPCVTAIDFKYRQNRLNMVVFFRSQDTLNLFLPDLHFLHSIQREVLEHLVNSRKDLNEAEIGDLAFILACAHASRAGLAKMRVRFRKR